MAAPKFPELTPQRSIPLSKTIVTILQTLKAQHPGEIKALTEFLLALRYELECDHKCKDRSRGQTISTQQGLDYITHIKPCQICAVFTGDRAPTLSLKARSSYLAIKAKWRPRGGP